ncbi:MULTISPECIES: DUF371 domain-containing protein [unclassified Crossiella]|uniref:DUF371 domain-containing protein n=1 Tax=unclassified Crossiella TaxID=2620835 RepID=UPI001FFE93BE|nr:MULTISPECIES: DUF371 domain-containing protein [unclassified Crossiella]MCK2236636.1 DUF371 domain-containing protein [Crossiella sp. S99.2]MCK2250304.1 DUF371 domain-containing protein [Crossiella sp. S99.1]
MTTIRAHGHPEIRATHNKTWELTPDAELTARATCVLGVRAVAEGGPLAGPVQLRISVGEHSVLVRAVGNPNWVPGGPAVIRRSSVRLPNTLATDADLSAADLPRDLAAQLTDPAVAITVEVAAVEDPGTLVLFHANGSSPRLRAELAAADTVIAEDAGARALVGRSTGEGGRTLVVATEDLPGRTVRHLLGDRTEVIGLPPGLAAAAASPSPAGIFLTEPARKPADALRGAPLDAKVVLRLAAEHADKVLAAARDRGARTLAVATEPYAESERPRWGEIGALALPDRGEFWLCLDPAATQGLDPLLHKLVTGLLAQGVPARSVAQSLADLPGFTRRTAYDAVQQLKDIGS